jgi:hypothetical protein
MAGKADVCSLCGTTLRVQDNADDGALNLRLDCPNPDCAGRWTATEFGGEEGMRNSYDVPGLNGPPD